MAKEIPVGRKGLVALVSDRIYDEVAQHRWYPVNACGLTYAVRKYYEGQTRKTQYMHTFITSYTRTDHVNHNGLDNRDENLRAATARQNMMNKRSQIGSSSRHKGVYWDKRAKKWAARIRTSQGRKFLGLFIDEDDAGRAYDVAARDEFGEYACANLPQSGANGQTGEWHAP